MEKQEPRNKPPFQDKNKPPQLVWQLGSPSILRAPSHGLHTGSPRAVVALPGSWEDRAQRNMGLWARTGNGESALNRHLEKEIQTLMKV